MEVGTTDILYHPTFLGGTGIEQPWMSFLQGPTGGLRTSHFAQFAGKNDPLRSTRACGRFRRSVKRQTRAARS